MCAVVQVVPISLRLATMSRRSFFACERRSESCFGLFERLSSAAEMARTVPALKAALWTIAVSPALSMAKSGTYC